VRDRILKLIDLRRILRSFDCWEDASRGKGGHTMFFREINGKRFSVPYSGDKEVLKCYVSQMRRKFRLTPADGISDEDFYSR